MKKYISEEEPSGRASVNVDENVFGDVELFAALMQMKESRQNWWEGIGPGGSISARVIVSDGNVFFGACDRVFYSLTMDGKEKWRFKTNGVVFEGCAVSKDSVFFGSGDGNVYTLDKKTGEMKWRFQTKDKVVEMPLYHNERLYVSGCLDFNFYCLNANTGKKIWRFRTKGGTVALPLIHNNRIYCGYGDRNFYCLDMNGKIIWKFPAKNTIAAWPAVHYNNKLYFGSWDCNLYCIDMEGNLKWKFPVPHPVMSPHRWEGKIYFSCWDNNVYCLDAETGSMEWKFEMNGFPCGGFAVTDGVVYTGSTDNNVYAINAKTGKEIWKFETNGMVAQTTAFGDYVYAGSWDCNLYCLDAKTGRLIWKFHTSMSTPSKINPPEITLAKTAEFIWQPQIERKKETKEEDVSIADYGEFSGTYIDTTKSDYLGRRKKGYKPA